MLQKQVALAEGQVALAEKVYSQLVSTLEEKNKVMEESNKEVVTTLKGRNEELIQAKENLETELAIAKAEKNAVVNTRVVVAIAAKSMFPTARSTTNATKELAKLLKVNNDLENNLLTDQAMAWLEDLHGEVPDKDLVTSVCGELRDLYHTLSMDQHFPDGPSPGLSPGLYIGNAKQPTKAAAALVVLKAQDERRFPAGIPPVYYLREDHEVLHLRHSRVYTDLTRLISGLRP